MFSLYLLYFEKGRTKRFTCNSTRAGDWDKSKYILFWTLGLFGTCQIPDQHTPKVGYRGNDCAFIGYSLTSRVYHILNLETASPNTMTESIH